MTLRTQAYIAGTLGVAAAFVMMGFAWTWTCANPLRFFSYLALGILAAGTKIKLPGVTGTLSVNFLFVLIGIFELSLGEALMIACTGALTQCLWKAKVPPKPVQVAFSVAAVTNATGISFLAAGHITAAVLRELPFATVIAAVVYFITNTFQIAAVISLTENRRLTTVWRECYLWSFPNYLIGGLTVGILCITNKLFGWQTSVVLLPVMYSQYRTYRLYLDRLEQGRAHAEELRLAANRLNSVLESTTDCVIAVTAEGRVTYTNQRARMRLFGNADVGGTVLWQRFPNLANGAFREQIQKALADKSTLYCEEFFPELNAWFVVHAYPSAEGIALYLKEVTEQRELAEQLRQAQKMEAIGRLAGGVAHDFNNLLTIILGYGQVVAELLDKDHAAESSITEVLKAGERASALTQQLLAFSRKQVQQPVVIDLNSVVTGMERMLRRLIGEDIRVSVSLDPRIGNIRADRNQIEQVIMNLAVNARDAMPNGGELTIATRRHLATAGEGDPRTHAPGQYAVLCVRDTGHGFDAQTKAKIFEPFFTTKEKGKGTGLGLSTVYGIVQQSDGQITVQSEPGRGAEFCIHLPCVDEDREEPTAQTSQVAAVSASGKILLVEDEQAVRELALRLLKQAGYSVISPKEPSDALRLSKSELNSIDLVVTDVVMPGMNGPELVAHLLTRRPDLKVLYMSGYNDHPLFRAGVLSDRATLLQKPFSRTDLLAKVRSVLPSSACADARA